MNLFKCILVFPLTIIIIAACGGGGGGSANPASNQMTPLVVDASNRYKGVKTPAQLDKLFIQSILADYFSNVLFFDSQKLSDEFIYELINQPSATEKINCSRGGSQTANLYHKQGLTYFRINSKQCNETGIAITGNIEYEIQDISGSQKLSYDGLKVGDLTFYGTLESNGQSEKSLVNFLFSNQGQGYEFH